MLGKPAEQDLQYPGWYDTHPELVRYLTQFEQDCDGRKFRQIEDHFPACFGGDKAEIVEIRKDIMDMLKSLFRFNPGHRPSMSELLKNKVFNDTENTVSRFITSPPSVDSLDQLDAVFSELSLSTQPDAVQAQLRRSNATCKALDKCIDREERKTVLVREIENIQECIAYNNACKERALVGNYRRGSRLSIPASLSKSSFDDNIVLNDSYASMVPVNNTDTTIDTFSTASTDSVFQNNDYTTGSAPSLLPYINELGSSQVPSAQKMFDSRIDATGSGQYYSLKHGYSRDGVDSPDTDEESLPVENRRGKYNVKYWDSSLSSQYIALELKKEAPEKPKKPSKKKNDACAAASEKTSKGKGYLRPIKRTLKALQRLAGFGGKAKHGKDMKYREEKGCDQLAT